MGAAMGFFKNLKKKNKLKKNKSLDYHHLVASREREREREREFCIARLCYSDWTRLRRTIHATPRREHARERRGDSRRALINGRRYRCTGRSVVTGTGAGGAIIVHS